jgi:hypothetical protein
MGSTDWVGRVRYCCTESRDLLRRDKWIGNGLNDEWTRSFVSIATINECDGTRNMHIVLQIGTILFIAISLPPLNTSCSSHNSMNDDKNDMMLEKMLVKMMVTLCD